MPKYAQCLKRKDSPPLCTDQSDALDAYFTQGQVCVDAGAGTGKTTTLVEIACEVVLSRQGPSNPFRRLLIVTFGVEASRHLKTKIRDRLLDHVAGGGAMGTDNLRYLESQSDIQTIDSLIYSLVSEIAVDVGMSLRSEIADAFAQRSMVDELIDEVLRDPRLRSCWERLLSLYPARTDPYGPESLRDMLWMTHQKMREFCWDVLGVERGLTDALKSMHANRPLPLTITDLGMIVQHARGSNAAVQISGMTDDEAIAAVEDVFNTTLAAINDLVSILREFDLLYDARTKSEGLYSYIDLAYIVWRYMQSQDGMQWRQALSLRYDDVMVDEYQDTSHVQNEILKAFIRDSGSNDFARLFLIGDVKQSIYQWRSAEPTIFLDLINTLRNGQSFPQPFSHMVRRPLITNFRSHQSLIQFFNVVFSDVFADPLRGAISGSVPYVDLLPSKFQNIPKGHSRVHVMSNNGNNTETWTQAEAERIAELVNGGLSTLDRSGSDEKKTYTHSDVALLFRRTRYIPDYVKALRALGMKCAVIADISLFQEVEVSLVVDVLDWLANPSSKDSLLRILRSPIVALSDKTLRYLVSQKMYLTSALRQWPSQHLPADDKVRLQDLIRLRNDVRWDREGPKADLVSKIIAHSFLDSIVVASANGLQAHANLWLLVELISSWESEELLRYDKFVERLKATREDAAGPMGRDYPRAILADDKSKDSVKVLTVHAAKGLEFPIVFLCDSIAQTGTMAVKERMVRSRRTGILLKPVASGGTRSVSGIVADNSGRPLDWIAPNSESLLWVSPKRNANSGELLSTAPWQSALLEEQAEFWRLLYVALTRAKDHLFFSIGINNDENELLYRPARASMNEYPWTSWMPLLRELIHYDQLKAGQVTHLAYALPGTKNTVTIPIGLDEISPKVTSRPASPIYSIKMGTSLSSAALKVPSFVPARINASECGVMVECPRRYQYESLWRVSRIRERFRRQQAHSSGSIPSGLSPDEFGTCVHELLEQRNFKIPVGEDANLLDLVDPSSGSRYARRFSQAQLSGLLSAVSKFDETSSYAYVNQRVSAGAEFLTEFRVHSVLSIQGYSDIPVEGYVDLLVKEVDGSWLALDYKVEPKPASGSYTERTHRMQLTAYSWLLKEHFGWTVSRCAIVYLWPSADVVEFVPQPDDFPDQLSRALRTIVIDPLKGLIAKPSSGPAGRCDSCPYGRSIGGICEHG